MANSASAAEAKPKPKKAALAKAKKKALAKAKKRAKVKAKHKKPKPKVRGHVSKKVLTVIGTARGETIVLRLKAGKPHRLQVDVGNNGSAEWEVNRNRFDRIFVFALGGDDRVLIDEANGVFTDTEATTLSGDRATTTSEEAAGPSGSSAASTTTPSTETEATISRISGRATTRSPGIPVTAATPLRARPAPTRCAVRRRGHFDVSANGPRVRFFRQPANITMDLDDVERILTQALGGADSAVVHDMSGTDLKNADFELEAAIGGNAGDGAADTVTVEGTNGPTRSRWRRTPARST